MNLRLSPSNLLSWFRRLGANVYFWSGLATLIAVGAVVYVAIDFFVMPAYTRHDVSITVPAVENQPVEKARELLSEKGLQVEQQAGRYNPNIPRDVVVDQSPPPNSAVKPGRRVYLTINTGEVPTVQIPDLTGTSLREARNRITSIGLTVGEVEVDSIPSPYPQTVTRQKPAPGDSLKKGESVALWYSTGLGTTTARVPALVGLHVDRAQQLLLRQKLRSVVVRSSDGMPEEDTADAPTVTEASSDTSKVPLFVREQSRAPGTRVRVGTEIRLFTTTDSTAARKRRQALPDSLALPGDTASPARRDAAPDTTSADTTRIGF